MTFPEYYKINSINELNKVISFIIKEMKKGTLVQHWDSNNSFATPMKVEELVDPETFPDYIEMYFSTTDQKAQFKLAVETYHGSGGEWERIQ